VEKHGRAIQATHDNTIRRKRIACWLPKTTKTHKQVVYYLPLFHCNNGWTNAPQYPLHLYRVRHKSINTPLSHERLAVRTWLAVYSGGG